MKKITALLLASLTLTGCSSNLNFQNYFAKGFKSASKGEVIAEVNGQPICIDQIRKDMQLSLGFEFNNEQTKQLSDDPLMKNIYLDSLIAQYLIINDMSDSGMLNSQQFNEYMWLAIREASVKYYLHNKFFEIPDNNKWKEVLITTDEEVNLFYENNKQEFNAKGITKETAIPAIKSDMESTKNKLFLAELQNFRNILIDDLKMKNKVKKSGF